MAKLCSWCGKQIGFTDMAYDWIEIEKKGYYICGKCCNDIASVKEGTATYSGIKTEDTAPELFYYFSKEEPSENAIRYEEQKKEQQHIKELAQKTDPLFDEIHQIAGDLRFIKNCIIIAILFGLILGIMYLISIL